MDEPHGYVTVHGPFAEGERTAIERLLLNEAARVVAEHPLARIMRWEREVPDVLRVTTTTERLAQRLGHAVEKAFGGVVRYDFSHENKQARVDWHR